MKISYIKMKCNKIDFFLNSMKETRPMSDARPVTIGQDNFFRDTE